MKRLLRWGVFLGLLGAVVFWGATRPTRTDPAALAAFIPDAARGALVFDAGGCASCHAAPGAKGDATRTLSGGKRFPSPFGTFLAPNISSDPVHGIGTWSASDLVNAMKHGVSPRGSHYFPAFPYTTYIRADLADIVDLHAYLATLPASDAARQRHEVGFPFNIRRTLGGWKLLFLSPDWVLAEAPTPQLVRGRYLVEALGHCGECHTPRNVLGGIKRAAWLGGAPNPAGRGTIPNITPGRLTWSEGEIAEYLSSGFTPEFDVAGGVMAEVIENTARLSPEDRAAIAAYLKAVPPVASAN